jgi:transmembrane sensor
MTDTDCNILRVETLQDEAHAWLRRLTSGTATHADMDALDQWRGNSPAHARAFAEAALLWDVLGEATQVAVDRNPAFGRSAAPTMYRPSRRAFVIGGGTALATSVAGLAMIRPPLDLWPSFSDLAADYRTHTGERRQIEVADAVSIEMNTQTSIGRRPVASGVQTIELITGEAAIAKRNDPAREFVVLAGAGRAGASRAVFNIRKAGVSVCVTCIEGEVHVQHRQGNIALGDGQQVTYGEDGLGQVVGIDSEIVTAWRKGLLIFRDIPLARVIEEVNRYRPGRIVLLDAGLGRRQVVANFRLDRLEDVVTFVKQVMNAPMRSLPGGIVLLG